MCLPQLDICIQCDIYIVLITPLGHGGLGHPKVYINLVSVVNSVSVCCIEFRV